MELTFDYYGFEFPSPLGVSYFQIEITIDCGEDEDSFPSPLGVSYFQMSL